LNNNKTEFRHQPGRGTIWREPADKPSAWSGTVTLPDGSQAWLNLYQATDRDTGALRKDKDGQPFYNVTIKPKQQTHQSGGGDPYQDRSKVEPAVDADMDDAIPFITAHGLI